MTVEEIISKDFAEELSKGEIPWHRPWFCFHQRPVNWVSQKPYSISNMLLLKRPGEWMTFKQIKDNGGTLKKGSHSRYVVFYTFRYMVLGKDEEGIIKAKQVTYEELKKLLDNKEITEEQVRTQATLRYYRVFHINDIEGIESKVEFDKEGSEVTQDEIERIIRDYTRWQGIEIREGGELTPCYVMGMDLVRMPDRRLFKNANQYYATVFHELVHSTIEGNRLNRVGWYEEKRKKRGSDKVIWDEVEEVIADIASSLIINELGLEDYDTRENNKAYIQAWGKRLLKDSKLFLKTVREAEKAAKMVLMKIDDGGEEIVGNVDIKE